MKKPKARTTEASGPAHAGSPTRLWEVDHPYYCSESNYYSREPYTREESWAEFMDGMGTSDEELNLLFRWDWKRYEADEEDGTPAHDVFQAFFVLQRKGIFACHEVDVTEADEPAVRAWLLTRLPHLLALWEPLIDSEGVRHG